MGMRCNRVVRGGTTCVWEPSPEQIGHFQFCFSADDNKVNR